MIRDVPKWFKIQSFRRTFYVSLLDQLLLHKQVKFLNVKMTDLLISSHGYVGKSTYRQTARFKPT